MGDAGRVGILLLQLGTPAAPTPAALKRYLREFLSDRRVVDLPRWQWWPILNLIVLQTRPRASARLYQKVWTPEGSPLAVTTARQATLLESRLNASGANVRVVTAMRYGEPSIAAALAALGADGIDRLLAFPMYPQYAGATTGS
ncbi:MAG TPA: ferrochelatase, partial [Vicinamibacterales bacterium]|nr:ferrochelatase [Vicinamibacterales bacterium]